MIGNINANLVFYLKWFLTSQSLRDQDRFAHLRWEECVFLHSIHFLWLKKPAVGNPGCSPIKYLYDLCKIFWFIAISQTSVMINGECYLLVIKVPSYSSPHKTTRTRHQRGRKHQRTPGTSQPRTWSQTHYCKFSTSSMRNCTDM